MRKGLKGSLKKGMTVTARFFVARRSLWELLYENLDIHFNPAHEMRRHRDARVVAKNSRNLKASRHTSG